MSFALLENKNDECHVASLSLICVMGSLEKLLNANLTVIKKKSFTGKKTCNKKQGSFQHSMKH